MQEEPDHGVGVCVCAATASGNIAELSELLLSSGTAASNATDPYGVTALTIGCCMGHAEAVQLLLQHRADANALCSEMGPAPLHMANLP